MWALLLACRVEVGTPGAITPEATGPRELWLYTSMYEEVLAAMRPLWQERFPGVQIEVFQSGSEKVAQRYETELAAGGSRACLLATSDPAWYEDLAERGELLPFVAPRALALDRRWLHPDGAYAAVRVSLMVLASSVEPAPTSFRELADPVWKDRITSPDPLSSGTAFTSWSRLEAAYGEDWLRSVRDNGLVASGGNSSALARMESGERPTGMILLENLLIKTGSTATPVLPSDGLIAVAGPLAITKGCPDVLLAQEVASWFLSDEAQALIVAGGMHSPLPGKAGPFGTPALDELELFPESAAVDAAAFKQRWASRVAGP